MNNHNGDANKMVEDYRHKAIEDGVHIYTLAMRCERYREALRSALEENAHLHNIIERASEARFVWRGDEDNCSKMLAILNEAKPQQPAARP